MRVSGESLLKGLKRLIPHLCLATDSFCITLGQCPFYHSTALAAGHGFLAGWAFAVAGDMLYFAVIALTTLRLNSYFRDPNTTMLIVLGAMLIVPVVVRKFRSAQGMILCRRNNQA
jgi:hypothetical protein